MGQEEVYNYLKKKGNPVSAREIADKLRISLPSVNNCLNRMMHHNEISCVIKSISVKGSFGTTYKKNCNFYKIGR